MRKSIYSNNRIFVQFSEQVVLSANSRLTVEQKIEALKLLDGGSSEQMWPTGSRPERGRLIVSSDLETTLRI